MPRLAARARRRGWAEAWAVAALAATCALGAALADPDGVPSNAGLLASHPPWQDVVTPGGDPHLLDEIHQVEPWLLFLRHELRAGRFPFWNPHQHSGEPYWSAGQTAPLFPLHLLFAALPHRLGLVLLPWLRLAVGGLGAWALARQLGVAARPALLAAVAYPLCGPVTAFALFPMGNTHALLPWVLWSVERLAAGRGSWIALAVAGGLQLLGGHPETPVLTALLATVYLLVRHPPRAARAWGGFVAGWAAAGALSAVHNLPLAGTLLASSKWLEWHEPDGIPWGTRTRLLLRAVLPFPWGTSADGSWWGPYNEPATRLYAGVAVVALAAAALPRVRRDPRLRAVAALGIAALAGAYQFPGARELLLGLPLVRHALHHYLKIGLSLALVLLAAAGWQRLLRSRGGRPGLAGAGVATSALVAGTALFLPGWRLQGDLTRQAAWLAVGAAVAGALLACRALPVAARPRLVWAAPALLALELGLAHAPRVPAAPLASVYPTTPLVERLAALPGRIAGTGTAMRPAAAMVYGLRDVRGDTPVKLARYQRVYGSLAEPDAIYFRPVRRWTDAWLDRLGVRWVVGAPREAPPVAGWRLAYDGSDGRVWERPGAAPLVRWDEARWDEARWDEARWDDADGRGARGDDASAGMPAARVLRHEPGKWRVAWRTRTAARLIVAETWDPGWRAWAAGKPLPVRPWREVLMAVELPAGSGELALSYLPRWLPAGAALSAAALLAILVTSWQRSRRRAAGGPWRSGRGRRAAPPPAATPPG